MISVICVYNDKATLDALLVASLQRQDVGCDLVCIDNTAGQHRCAATVLNAAGCAAANDIVMFVHQDVELLSSSWLSDAERGLGALGVGAAAGVAGVDGDGATWSSVWHGEPRRFSGVSRNLFDRHVYLSDDRRRNVRQIFRNETFLARNDRY